MKLDEILLQNFRGFTSFEISFEPEFTVLLGKNMAGKSAVLDACAIALSVMLERLPNTPTRDIKDNEVHQTVTELNGVPDLAGQFPVILRARAVAWSGRYEWRRFRNGQVTDTWQADAIQAVINNSNTSDATFSLPIIAQYGTQRVRLGEHAPEERRGIGSRYDGYHACFNITSTHSLLAGWMRKQTLIQLQRGAGYLQPQLAAVEAAVKSCIAEVERFWFDVQYDELRLLRSDGSIQSFSMLSEGVRNMIAMIADIAWRTAVLNPQFGSEAHLNTDGVVLIDELDLHLHPSWQRRVASDLRRTFPRIQFIVTTHSPQIVSSVRRPQIRMLDRNSLVANPPHVEGRASNEILEDVFDVPARPEQVQAELKTLYQLIENEEFTAARAQLSALRERLGPEDSDMVRAQWILDTEDPAPNEQPTTAP